MAENPFVRQRLFDVRSYAERENNVARMMQAELEELHRKYEETRSRLARVLAALQEQQHRVDNLKANRLELEDQLGRLNVKAKEAHRVREAAMNQHDHLVQVAQQLETELHAPPSPPPLPTRGR
jgi:septal ring factor EnvC (AmiA/AmiB activator)